MFTRIVVGTDGSETAAEAVRQAADLAKLTNATLSIVSAYEPVSGRRIKDEQQGAPVDVQHEINPREDVNLVLWRWGAEDGAHVRVIDDERRLGGRRTS